MALPASGAISLSQVNTELGFATTTPISLNDSLYRELTNTTGYGTTTSLATAYAKSKYEWVGFNQGSASGVPNGAMGSNTGSSAVANRISLVTPTAGYFFYGPYVTLPSGSFTVVIKGYVPSMGTNWATIDIVNNYGGSTVKAEYYISGGSVNGVISSTNFTLPATTTLIEVRMYIYTPPPANTMYFSSLEIYKV
jgi:hypothetical protein